MDPITQKIISLTETPSGATVSDLFDTYAWIGSSDSNSATGIHTSISCVDMTEGGMAMGKRGDISSDWYVTDTVTSPLDGSQGTPGYGSAEWTQSPPLTTGAWNNGTWQNWTVPAGVTSVCMLCIGGGAGADGGNNGGGGGLVWINDVPVTPGTTLQIYHGRTGGRNGSWNGQDGHGEYSSIIDANGIQIIQAWGGHKGYYNGIGGGHGGDWDHRDPIYQSLPYGGAKGGDGAGGGGAQGKGGGGGASGYSGNGGDGGSPCSNGAAGQGGGGGGGGGNCNQDGGQGGGVGIYGEGANGAGGGYGNYASPGQGGSGGGAGAGTYGQWTSETGKFGGGSGAGSGGAGRGAVRIVWGAGRAFPSTNVGQDPTYTHADYGSFNNADKLHTNMSRGIKEWTSKGFVWEGCDPDTGLNIMHQSNRNFVYLFKKFKKFFTIVEFTGNGGNQEIPHDLGCEPSMMWIKNIEDDGHSWAVYHKNIDATNPEAYQLFLDTDDDRIGSGDIWNNTKPTSSHFSVGNNAHTNTSSKKYVAYLFGADQAVFGETNNGVVAKTGTYTGNSGVRTIDLGWEPQMVMIKHISGPGSPKNWIIMDKMRLMSMNRSASSGLDGMQYINLPGTQDLTNSFIDFTIDGFQFNQSVSGSNWNATGNEYVYYAVRNDMLSKPQSASEVYATSVGTGIYPSFISNFPVDMGWAKQTNTNGTPWNAGFRKSGAFDMKLNDQWTNEGSYSDFQWHNSIGWNWGTRDQYNQSWMFKRAKGFFDVQYWNGTGTERLIDHQLGTVPELAIVKSRKTGNDGWYVYHKDLPSQSYVILDRDYGRGQGGNCWTAQLPTATQFPLGTDNAVNANTNDYVGQFFSSLSGISKIGSYEVNANGDNVTVECGFIPNFLLVKRYEVNGAGGGSGADWLLFDSLRGMATVNPSFGQAEWTTGGTYSWTCPAGVTSVCAVCVGSGGGQRSGGGGGLGWKNNIPVTPGQSYTVEVGAGTQGNGSQSYFIDATTVQGGGGAGNGVQGDGGGYVGDGGGNGGVGSIGAHGDHGGGGGAGGYSGTGGTGGVSQAGGDTTGTDGTGGAGGGGGGFSNGYAQGTGGGGVGIYGEGASGTGGTGQNAGQGGSGGETPPVSASYPNGRRGGAYGGGAGTYSSSQWWDQNGGGGAVRLVWSVDGSPVAFPSTNVQQQSSGHDSVLEVNKDMPAVTDTDYLNRTSSGFSVNTNTVLTTPNSKYIFLAIA